METLLGLTMIVLALAIPISCAEMFKRWVSYKEAQLAAQGSSAENKALEARIKVLERIVTERGFDVAAQIEALRDTTNGSGVPLDMMQKERA
jgi:hypothetical protein